MQVMSDAMTIELFDTMVENGGRKKIAWEAVEAKKLTDFICEKAAAFAFVCHSSIFLQKRENDSLNS